jgi:uncharacterized tellurite resistance protein B-like protein
LQIHGISKNYDFWVSTANFSERLKAQHFSGDIMTNSHKLLRVLIGVAWIDGQLQDTERSLILELAKKQGLAEDPVIIDLLNNMDDRSIQLADCQRWIHDYLGDRPSSANYQQLLEDLSSIIYSDSDVATAEAQLLMNYQQLDPLLKPTDLTVGQTILAKLRTVYQKLAA